MKWLAGSITGCFSQSKLQASTFQLVTLVHVEVAMCYNLFTQSLSLSHLCRICSEVADLQLCWCNLGQAPLLLNRFAPPVFQAVAGTGVGGELAQLALVMRAEI